MDLSYENPNPEPMKAPSAKREIAVGTAATLLFFFSVVLVPVVGLFMGAFTPLPTLLVFYRWGAPLGYWIPGLATALGGLVMLFLGMGLSIPYLLEMLILGLFLAFGMRRRWPMEKTVGGASLLIFLMGIVVFWLNYAGADGKVFENIEADLRAAVDVMLKQVGGDSADKGLVEQSIQEVLPTMARLVPGAALASALVVSWLNLLVALRYCRIQYLPLPPWRDWSRWKSPEVLVWAVIACGFSLFVPAYPVRMVALNGLLVLATIYLFQGMSVVSFYFERWKLPRFLRAVGYGILLMQQLVTFGTILMGLFDVWFDFRRISPKTPEVS